MKLKTFSLLVLYEIIIAFIFLLGVFVGRASACDSYEDCMEKSRHARFAFEAKAYSDTAMAYKLDEICKKIKP